MKEINKPVLLDRINFDTDYTGRGETFVTVTTDKQNGKTYAHVFERNNPIATLWIKFIAKISNWNSDSKIHTLREFEVLRTAKDKTTINKNNALLNIKALSELPDREAALRILNGDSVTPEVDGDSNSQQTSFIRVRALASSEVTNAIAHFKNVREWKQGIVALINEARKANSGSGVLGGQIGQRPFDTQDAGQRANQLLSRRLDKLPISEIKTLIQDSELLIEAYGKMLAPTPDCKKAFEHLSKQLTTYQGLVKKDEEVKLRETKKDEERKLNENLKNIHALFSDATGECQKKQCSLSVEESSLLTMSFSQFEAICKPILNGTGKTADFLGLGNMLMLLDKLSLYGVLPKTFPAYKVIAGLYDKFHDAVEKDEALKGQFEKFRKISGRHLSDRSLLAIGHHSLGSDSDRKKIQESSEERKKAIVNAKYLTGDVLVGRFRRFVETLHSQYPEYRQKHSDEVNGMQGLIKDILARLRLFESDGIMGPESKSCLLDLIGQIPKFLVAQEFIFKHDPKMKKHVEEVYSAFVEAVQ